MDASETLDPEKRRLACPPIHAPIITASTPHAAGSFRLSGLSGLSVKGSPGHTRRCAQAKLADPALRPDSSRASPVLCSARGNSRRENASKPSLTSRIMDRPGLNSSTTTGIARLNMGHQRTASSSSPGMSRGLSKSSALARQKLVSRRHQNRHIPAFP